jgi:hypothetical protein
MRFNRGLLIFIVGIAVGVIVVPYLLSYVREMRLALRYGMLDEKVLDSNNVVGCWIDTDQRSGIRGIELTAFGKYNHLSIHGETGALAYDPEPFRWGNFSGYEIHDDWIYLGDRGYSFALRYKSRYEVTDSTLIMKDEQGRVTVQYRKYRIGDNVARLTSSHLSGLVGLYPFTSYDRGVSEIPEDQYNRNPHAEYEDNYNFKNLTIRSRHAINGYNPDDIFLRVLPYRGIGRYYVDSAPSISMQYGSGNSYNFYNDPYRQYFATSLYPTSGIMTDATNAYIDIAVMDTVRKRCKGKFMFNILGTRRRGIVGEVDTIPVQGTFDVVVVNPNELRRKMQNIK